MENRIEVKVGITDVEKANLFLRALWSEMRQQLGGCSWYFTPITNRQKREIYFGQFTTQDEATGTIEVYVTYVRKGGIETIIFINKKLDISHLGPIVKTVAESFEAKIRKVRISHIVELNYPISNYEEASFSITPINKIQTELKILLIISITFLGR